MILWMLRAIMCWAIMTLKWWISLSNRSVQAGNALKYMILLSKLGGSYASDGNDLSFIAYPQDSEGYRKSRKYYRENKIRSLMEWRSGAGADELVAGVLKELESAKEKVMLFCHFPYRRITIF